MSVEHQRDTGSGVCISRSSTPSVQLSISKLLPEILILVFQLSVASSQSPKSTQQRRNSQVCQFWREVGLGCPWLWASELHLDSPSLWFHEALRRSANVPVNLSKYNFTGHVDSGYTRRAQENLDFLLENVSVSRCITFDVCFQGYPADRAFQHTLDRLERTWAAFQQPMPHLQTFCLVLRIRDHDYDPLDDPQEFQAVQKNFFGNHAPNLRSLVVSNIWSLSCLSSCSANLRTLDISTIHPLPSASQWLQALQASPLLEDLRIHQGFSEKHDSKLSQMPVVRLDHLVRLRFDGKLSAQVPILSHLAMPRINDLNICSYELEPTGRPPAYGQSDIDPYEEFACVLDKVYEHRGRVNRSILYISLAAHRLEVSIFSAGSVEGPTFCIDLQWKTQDELIPILCFLTNLDCFVSSVDIIRVDLWPEPRRASSPYDWFVQPHLKPELRQLARPFHDLFVQLDQDLELRLETLPSLVNLCKLLPYGTFMCSLRTVCFDFHAYDEDEDAIACEYTLLFLRSRQNIGSDQRLVVRSEWNPTGERAQAFKDEINEINEMDWIYVDCSLWLV